VLAKVINFIWIKMIEEVQKPRIYSNLCEKMFGFDTDKINKEGMSKKVEEKILSAKLKDRSCKYYLSYLDILDLKPAGWTKFGYANSPFCDLLLHQGCKENITRIHHKDLSVDEFREKFEKTDTPIVIEGLTEDMEVEKYWTFEVSIYSICQFARLFSIDTKTRNSKLQKMIKERV